MSEFTLPELGENISSGEVTRVLVAVGDTVVRDQIVIEIETEKATIEVPSTVPGVVTHVNVNVGDTVAVGATVLTLRDDPALPAATRSLADTVLSEHPVPSERTVPATDTLPRTLPTKTSPTSTLPTSILPASTLPASTLPASTLSASTLSASTLSASTVPRAPAETGGHLAIVHSARPTPEPDAEPPRHRVAAAPAAPAVRRLAREVGIEIDAVRGSGPDGRISEMDVKAHARQVVSRAGDLGGLEPKARRLPDFSKWGEIERTRMSSIRRATADHVSYAWQTIPHVTQFDRADITELEDVRRRGMPLFESRGIKLTLTAFLVKALATGLQRFPQFNASVDAESQTIVRKKYVSVGVAIDTDRGLVVPVLRDVEVKSVATIAAEVHEMSAKARGGKLTLDDLSGGSMTLSNLGGIGGTFFTPIVNWPEVAILGVSRGVTEPVHTDEGFVPRVMLPLSLSYDHRAIDGADAMRFLRWLAQLLEHPLRLVL